MSRELLRTTVVVWAALVVVNGCAAEPEQRPEPETPHLTIDDQSTDAPPPPPPSAPPADAASAPPLPVPEQGRNGPPSPPPQPLGVPATPAPQGAPVTDPAPPPPSAPEGPPSSAEWAHEYPSGRWVYANDYGWMWVPANAASEDSDGVPYTYLYRPSYGWNWYVSPWGAGAYRYGGWVRRPYRPAGYQGGWVAHPRVVVRLGGHGRGYDHRRRRW